MALRVGVIGTGGIGQGHIQRFVSSVSGVEVVAVNDVNVEVAKRVAGECGARFEQDPHALIGAKDVDAVVVCSWDPTHEEFCVAGLEAGKYVFCEKPLSDTVEGCRRIMDKEMAGGKRLIQVGFMRRYDPAYRDMREAIASGRMGLPLLLHCKHRNQAPAGPTHTTDMSVTGSMVHEFDIIRYLVGEEDLYTSAQLVYPRTTRHAHEGLIDPQMVYLETKNGIRIDIETFQYCHYGYDVQCEVVCEDGTLSLPDPDKVVVRQANNCSFHIQPSWSTRFTEAYEIELREWVRSVNAGKLEGPSAWDGYITSAVADACVKSRVDKAIIPIEIGTCPDFYRK